MWQSHFDVVSFLVKQHCHLCLHPSELLICEECYWVLPFHRATPKLSPGQQFDEILALFDFTDLSQRFIHRFKYYGQLAMGVHLAALFAKAHQPHALPEVLLPVPLHWTRLWWRGFNQSTFLAQHLAGHYNLGVNRHLIKRKRKTKSQSQLPASKRAGNVAQAFALKGPCPYQHVALIDDVVTTGSTVNAIAGLLKVQGVARVDVWCLARA